MFDIYLKQVFFIVLLGSAVPLVFSSISGLIISVLQTATQVQEQSITFLFKFLSLCAVIYFGADWFVAEMIRFMAELIKSIEFLGRM